MQQWEQWKRAVEVAQKKPEKESVQCPTCSSTWFEQVEGFQFDANHQVVLGQKVPQTYANTIGYVLLRCLRCSDLLQPVILQSSREIGLKNSYDSFLDTMEGKGDTRKTVDQAVATPETVEVRDLKNRISELEASLAAKTAKKKDKDAVSS